MSHDYDFGGYLSPVGEPRPEMAEARVLAAFARTLGPALARATTTAADAVVSANVPTSASGSALVLDGGGTVTGVPNLGDEPGTATLAAAGGLPETAIALAPFSCALVLRDLPLAGFGLPGTLRLASADLVGAGPAGSSSPRACRASLALEGADGVKLVELDAPAPGAPVLTEVYSGGDRWTVEVFHPEDVATPDDTLGVLSEPLPEPEILTGATRLDLETRSGETSVHEFPRPLNRSASTGAARTTRPPSTVSKRC